MKRFEDGSRTGRSSGGGRVDAGGFRASEMGSVGGGSSRLISGVLGCDADDVDAERNCDCDTFLAYGECVYLCTRLKLSGSRGGICEDPWQIA